MRKRYVVRLSDAERTVLAEIVRKFKGSNQRVRRAQMLLKADADGPGWTDRQIAEAFNCRTKTVENVRQHLVERGFAADAQRDQTEQAADPQVAGWPTGGQDHCHASGATAPPGYANWTLRLLARRVVELKIVPTVSYETVRRSLKKTA